MSETPVEGAPTAAPRTTVQQLIESVAAGLKEVLPAAALALTLPLLVTHALPANSEKLALAIASAIAGFMTGRATSGRGSAP